MNPIPQTESIHAQLAALNTHAGVYPLTGRGWLRVTGPDRMRWLAGMLTNGIQQLTPGHGNYNFILSAQGRIQGDAYAYVRPEDVLLQTGAAQVEPLLTLLDRFIIMDDVELADITSEWYGTGLTGPAGASLLHAIGLPAEALEPITVVSLPYNGAEIVLIASYSPSAPSFELWSSTATAPQHLIAALTTAGATHCGPEALEAHRILSGIPVYGTDIRERDLPQETAQTRALHFSKGCYIGQEIVERIRSRGAVHRTLTGFLLHGDLPPAGTALELDGKPAGEITSSVHLGYRTVALGYIRREAELKKQPLTYPGGTAEAVLLPFASTTTSAASKDMK